MTRAGRILIWIVTAIVALLVAAILFVALFNWNHARAWLDQTLSGSIGRPVAIKGDLTVNWSLNPDSRGLAHWVPWPRFAARDVSIANPDWAKQVQFFSVGEVHFSLSPLALLGLTIDIPVLELIGTSVDIERDTKGRDNWTLKFAHGGQWKLHVDEVRLGAGKAKIDDDELALHLGIAVTPLGESVPFNQIEPPAPGVLGSASAAHSPQPYHFAWTAKGTWRGAEAIGNGKIGSLLAVSNASMPFPLQASLRLRDINIAMAGTLTDPVHLAALNLHLKLSADSMSHLYALTGIALPATPPFTTQGQLIASIREGTFKYEDFDGRVGRSDLHGGATYVTSGPRPKLTGTLNSNTLYLADLAPLIGADSNASKATRGESHTQPADKLLPAEPFDTTRWRHMDADVTFTGKRILRKTALPVYDLSAHLKLHDAVLMLDPVQLGVAGGDIKARIELDGRKDSMHGKADLSIRHLRLQKLFPAVDLMHASLGQINGDAALTGDGNSVATLLGTSDGKANLLVNNGAVSKLLLEEAGLNIGNIIVTTLVGDKPEKLNCAAADFVAKKGVWQSRLFVIDTDTATINAKGDVDFATERLDFVMHPQSKGIRVLSLRSPLYLRGTLKSPDAGVEKGPLLTRGLGALVLGVVAAPVAALAALIAPSHDNENACTDVIAKMR